VILKRPQVRFHLRLLYWDVAPTSITLDSAEKLKTVKRWVAEVSTQSVASSTTLASEIKNGVKSGKTSNGQVAVAKAVETSDEDSSDESSSEGEDEEIKATEELKATKGNVSSESSEDDSSSEDEVKVKDASDDEDSSGESSDGEESNTTIEVKVNEKKDSKVTTVSKPLPPPVEVNVRVAKKRRTSEGGAAVITAVVSTVQEVPTIQPTSHAQRNEKSKQRKQMNERFSRVQPDKIPVHNMKDNRYESKVRCIFRCSVVFFL
jgi:hypothetical protein